MPNIRDLLPPPPWEGLPIPKILRNQNPGAEGEPIPPEYRYLIPLMLHPRHPYYIPGKPDNPDNPAIRYLPPKMTSKDAVKMLKEGVERLVDSHEFREYLTAMSKFHRYSISNQMLILLQKPDATHVAGYVGWKDLGRWVIKDAKGIGILAPIFAPRPKPEEGEEDELAIAPSPIWFKVVYVFDISQTEGKPLPEFEVPALTGAVNEELFADLLALMKRKNIQVNFDSRPQLDPSLKGHYMRSEIWVRPEEPRAQQLKTLTHEVAHYYSEGVFRIPRRDAETIAESAAYVIGAHYGFDTGVRSFPYVALWAEDKKVLNDNLESIHKVVDAILRDLGRAEKE